MPAPCPGAALMWAQPCRWILPFSRQFTVTAITYVPLIPWRWKMACVKHYLRQHFYSQARLSHVAPPETEARMDYTGEPSKSWALQMMGGMLFADIMCRSVQRRHLPAGALGGAVGPGR